MGQRDRRIDGLRFAMLMPLFCVLKSAVVFLLFLFMCRCLFSTVLSFFVCFLFVCLLIYSSIHIKKEKHNFTREAQLEKDKTTLLIKWPTLAVPLTRGQNVAQH